MAFFSQKVPSHPSHESDESDDEDLTPTEYRTAPFYEPQSPRPTITAIRIPADRTLPSLTTLQLVKATSEYHFSLHDSTLSNYSSVGDLRDHHRHSSEFLDREADDDLVDPSELDDSRRHVDENADCFLEELEYPHSLNDNSYEDCMGQLLNVPLAKKTDAPHLTFTHASLRLQPNVADLYWRSGEAWNSRAFKRLYAVPREDADLEMMRGEYHIMYTHAAGRDLRPNVWARERICGDAFVLKMASGKNKDGDWYYEDMPDEILHCSLGNQCLETLRSVRPITWKILVGERGDGPPGVISPGTGLKGTTVRVSVGDVSECFTD